MVFLGIYTIPYALQQNGVVEKRNITLLDMVRSMMAQDNLPISFWGDELLTTAYILNRVPSKLSHPPHMNYVMASNLI